MSHRPHALLLAALALLLGAAAVRAATAANQARIDEFVAEAEQQRIRQGLDGPEVQGKLRGRYPTPEVTLERAQPLRRGQSLKVEVPGRFQSGSLFVLDRDDVTARGEKVTERSWRAELVVSPTAAAGPVALEVWAPVSALFASGTVAIVEVPFRAQLSLDDGRRVTVARVKAGYEARWTGGKGPATVPAFVSFANGSPPEITLCAPPTEGELSEVQRRVAEEEGERAEGDGEPSQPLKDDPEMTALAKKDPKCFRELGPGTYEVAEASAAECYLKHGPALMRILQRFSDRMEAENRKREEAATAKLGDEWRGCGELRLTPGGGPGDVSGEFAARQPPDPRVQPPPAVGLRGTIAWEK
jgi:hypothetical protein